MTKAKKGYKQVKGLFGKYAEIPEDWKIITIKDATTSHKQGFYTNQQYSKKGIRLVRITDLQNPNLDYESMPFVELDKKTTNDFKVHLGDFLFARSGAIGRFGIVTEDIPCVFASYIIRFQFDKAYLLNNYLGYALQTNFFEKQFNMIKQGSSNININAENIKSMKIIIPTKIDEQQKIALILSNTSNLISNTEKIINQIKSLKKGLIQKLLTSGIGHTKFKKVKWYFGKEIKIPNEWEVLELVELCKVRQGLQIPISDRFIESGTNRFQYITVKSIHSKEFNEYIENPSERVICTEEDILFTRTGNTGEIITNTKGVFHNNFFLVDFDKKKLIKDYLITSLKQHKIQGIIKSLAGATTIPDLNHGDFFRIKIMVPPIYEQEKISSILTNVDSQMQIQTQYREKLETLKKSLIQKLLTGQVRVKV